MQWISAAMACNAPAVAIAVADTPSMGPTGNGLKRPHCEHGIQDRHRRRLQGGCRQDPHGLRTGVPAAGTADRLRLRRWGSEYVVIDTHPGYHPITLGAFMAADLVIVPTTLDVNDLRGLAGMVRELVDYRMLIIPNRVPRIVPRMGRKFLGEVMAEAGPEVRVGPFVNENRHLGQRTLLMAISAGEASARYAACIRQMAAIAATVRELIR